MFCFLMSMLVTQVCVVCEKFTELFAEDLSLLSMLSFNKAY